MTKPKKLKPIVTIKPTEELVLALQESVGLSSNAAGLVASEEASEKIAAKDNFDTAQSTRESSDKGKLPVKDTLLIVAIIVLGVGLFLNVDKANVTAENLAIAQKEIAQLKKVETKTETPPAVIDLKEITDLKAELEVLKNQLANLSDSELGTVKIEIARMREQSVTAITKIEKQLYRINRYFGWVE